MVTILSFLLGCTTLSTMHGAKTIEPETWEIGFGSSLQQNNPLSVSLGIPVPQVALSVRYGLQEDVDIGTMVYVGGFLTDVRYQFWEQGDWTVAIAPGIGGLASPVGGILDLRLPIRVQRSVGDRFDVVTGIVPVSQNTFVLLPSSRENYMNNYIGSFLRFQYSPGPVTLGLTLDVLDRSSRGGLPVWNVGADVSFSRSR